MVLEFGVPARTNFVCRSVADCFRGWSRPLITLLTAVTVVAIGSETGLAQARLAPGTAEEIQREARRILDTPEFRHLEGLPGRGGEGRGGQGRSGSGGPGDEQPGDGQSGGQGRGQGGAGRDARFGEGTEGGAGGSGQDGSGSGPNGGFPGGEVGGDAGGGGGGFDGGSPSPPPPESDMSSSFDPAPATALSQAVGGLAQILAWSVLAVIAGLIVFLIVKAIMDYERPEKLVGGDAGPGEAEGPLEPEHPPGEYPADVYLARARELAAAGRYREAITQLLLGAMSSLERAGLVRYRRGLTCRDYARAVRAHKPQYTSLRNMVRLYEPLAFGRRPAAHHHFERGLKEYQSGFAGPTNIES